MRRAEQLLVAVVERHSGVLTLHFDQRIGRVHHPLVSLDPSFEKLFPLGTATARFRRRPHRRLPERYRRFGRRGREQRFCVQSQVRVHALHCVQYMNITRTRTLVSVNLHE